MVPAGGIRDPLVTCSSLLSHLLRPLVQIFRNLSGMTNMVAVFETVTSILLNNVTILLSHLLRDHLSDFFLKLFWDVSLVVLLCMPKFGAGPSTNMATVSILNFSYRISSLTRGGISSKFCIWIPLNPCMCLCKNDSSPSTNMAILEIGLPLYTVSIWYLTPPCPHLPLPCPALPCPALPYLAPPHPTPPIFYSFISPFK